MKKIILTLSTLAACIFATGCASIVDGGDKTVHFRSTPPGAKFTIYDKKGEMIESRTTPANIPLKRSSGYFKGIEYRVKFEAPGYYPGEIALKSSVDGWYFGNILFGGLIGILIVDPATGDMYTLPKDFNYILIPSDPPLSEEEIKAAQLKANQPKELPPTHTKQR